MSFALYVNIKATYSSFTSLHKSTIECYWFRLENKYNAEKLFFAVKVTFIEVNRVRKQINAKGYILTALFSASFIFLIFFLPNHTPNVEIVISKFFNLFSSPFKAKIIGTIALFSSLIAIFIYRFIHKTTGKRLSVYLLLFFRIGFTLSIILLGVSKLIDGKNGIIELFTLCVIGISLLCLLASEGIKKVHKHTKNLKTKFHITNY